MTISAEDRLAIQEAASRVSHVFAEGDVETLVSLFTEDCVLEAGWGDAMTTRVEGREDLRKWAEQVFEIFPGLCLMRIWLANFVIDAESDTARLSCFFNELSIDGYSISTGRYRDVYRKQKGKWLLAHRQVLSDGSREERAAKEALVAARAKVTGVG